MAPIERSWFGGVVDRLAGWAWGLPAESCSYTVEDVRIPMDDKVELVAYLYRPLHSKPVGTLLVRTPYGIAGFMAVGTARIYAARGYQLLHVSCRGMFGSGGNFEIGGDEAADGHAVLAWMREQTWYTGSFATLGASYLGYTQWAILSDPPADMKSAIISVSMHDFGWGFWGTGALNSDFITWISMLTLLRKPRRLPPIVLFLRQGPRIRRAFESLPLLAGINNYVEGDMPARLEDSINHTDPKDPFWAVMQQNQALERANVPILLVGGWYDILLQSTMEQYSMLSKRGCDVALTVGPWSHMEAEGGITKRQTLAWLNHHFSDHSGVQRKLPVRIFVTGAEKWLELSHWPPASKAFELYLGPKSTLSEEPAGDDAKDSTFTYDPADPTPTVGSPMLINIHGGKQDDSGLAKRSDVLSFTTEVLDQDIEVCGKPSVEIFHSTSHPYADLLVRVSDVDPRGKSRNIAEGYVRLNGTRGPGPVQLSLLDCAHRFRKGHQIRLVIAGGSHPRYIRNLGTDENIATATTLRSVTHTIHHSASAVSKLVLPVSTDAL